MGDAPKVSGPDLAAGVPAVVKKELSGRSLEWIQMAAPDYHELSAAYLEQGLDQN